MEVWQPTPEVKALMAFISKGIPPLVLKARLFQIAMSDQNMAISLKAIELLQGVTLEDESGNADISLEHAQLIQQLTAGLLGDDGDLGTILADIGLGIDEGEEAGADSLGSALITRLGRNGIPSISIRPSQSDGDGRANADGTAGDQTPDSADAASPQQNGTMLDSISRVVPGQESDETNHPG